MRRYRRDGEFESSVIPEVWSFCHLVADVAVADQRRDIFDLLLIELLKDVALPLDPNVVRAPRIFQPREPLRGEIVRSVSACTAAGHSLLTKNGTAHEEPSFSIFHCVVGDLELKTGPVMLQRLAEKRPNVCVCERLREFVIAQTALRCVDIRIPLPSRELHRFPAGISAIYPGRTGVKPKATGCMSGQDGDAGQDFAEEFPLHDVIYRPSGHDSRAIPPHDANLPSHDEEHQKKGAVLNVEDELRITDDLFADLDSRYNFRFEVDLGVIEGIE